MTNFMRIRSAIVEFLHADRQTDTAKLTDAFSTFSSEHALKNVIPV
jgi:hypothetical protein